MRDHAPLKSTHLRFAGIVAIGIGLVGGVVCSLLFRWTIVMSDELGGVSYWYLPNQPIVGMIIAVSGIASCLGVSAAFALAYSARMVSRHSAEIGARRLLFASVAATACAIIAGIVSVGAFDFALNHHGFWGPPTSPYVDEAAAVFFFGRIFMLITGCISPTSALTAISLHKGQGGARTHFVAVAVTSLLTFVASVLVFSRFGGMEVIHESLSSMLLSD